VCIAFFASTTGKTAPPRVDHRIPDFHRHCAQQSGPESAGRLRCSSDPAAAAPSAGQPNVSCSSIQVTSSGGLMGKAQVVIGCWVLGDKVTQPGGWGAALRTKPISKQGKTKPSKLSGDQERKLLQGGRAARTPRATACQLAPPAPLCGVH